jgi:hypothetical protein
LAIACVRAGRDRRGKDGSKERTSVEDGTCEREPHREPSATVEQVRGLGWKPKARSALAEPGLGRRLHASRRDPSRRSLPRNRGVRTLASPKQKVEKIMKATDLLEKQHRKVEAIFRKLEGGRAEAEPLLIELANNLAAHMAIEQEIFYPAVAKVDDELVSESYEEHSLAEVALKRLLETDTEDEAFKARVIATKELIQHHVEEEEQELFKKVRKAFKEDELERLGKAMKARFDEVNAAGFENAVPKTFKKTSADMTRGRMHASGKMRVAEQHRNGRRRAA